VRAVINPLNMDTMSWFDRTTQLFADLIPPFKLQSADDWQAWGAAARRVQSKVPNPYEFADWSEWAERFNLVMGVA